MKQTENLQLPVLQSGDKYTKETQNEAFKKIDLHLGGLAKRVNNIVASGGESNIEIVDARRDNNTGVVYNTIGERINSVSEQLDTKANKDDIAKISSGTPLFASSIDSMTDNTKNYVNTTDGYLYVYNGSSFEKSTVKYQEYGLSDKQVTPIKTSFIEVIEPKNLINREKLELNKKLNVTTGDLEDNSNYHTTDFINVKDMQKYYIYYNYSGAYICSYDENKTFQRYMNNITLNDNKQISTWLNASYIRLAYESKNNNPDLRITSEKPNVFPAYEEYVEFGNKLKNIKIEELNYKLDKNLGSENAGKFLKTNDYGDIDVVDTPLVDERIFIGNEVTNANVKEHSISLGNGSGKQTQSAILAIGVDALKNNVEGATTSDDGKFNTAVGHHSMVRNTTGDHNTAFGWGCMGMNTTGKYNTAVGEDALLSNTSGDSNTCVGNRAYQLGQGSRNTIIGNNAMYTNESGATHPTGNANTAVGYLAGNDRGNGQNNAAFGADAKIADGCSYSISIGSNARVTKSKQCVIGTKDNIIENILHGDVIIYSNGKYRKLVFNSDYSISWIEVTI